MNDILLKNNNRAIIKKLANRSFRSNKIRNVIAVIAILLTTFLFTAVLTIGLGSAGTLEYNTAKAMGSQADALVQGLSAEQFKQLKENSMFQKVGCWIPIAHLNNTNRLSTEIDYADQTQLELRFLTPRTGSAPKNANEVLVSANVLEDMNIEEQIGVSIPVEFSIKEQTYHLDMIVSGIYDPPLEKSESVIVSEAFLDENQDLLSLASEGRRGCGIYNADVVMKDTSMMQERISEFIRTIGGNPDDNNADNAVRVAPNPSYRSSDSSLLAWIASSVFGILIMFCGYLLIYNIFDIAVANDVRQYGLLRTVGTTSRQVKHLVNRQALFMFLIGTPIGLFFGLLLGRGLLPVCIRLIATSFGEDKIETDSLPYFAIYVGAIIFSSLTVYISTRKPIKKASTISPVEAVRYIEQNNVFIKSKRNNKGKLIPRMAKTNTLRAKKRAIFIILSLTLSIILLNSVFVFSNSFDEDGYISRQTRSDFMIYNPDIAKTIIDDFGHNSGVSEETVNEIEQMPGVMNEVWLYRNTYEDIQISCDWGTSYPLVDTAFSAMLPDSLKLRRNENWGYAALTQDDHPLGNVFGFTENLLRKMDIIEGEKDLSILKEKLWSGNNVIPVAEYNDLGELKNGANNSDYEGLSVGDTIQFYENGIPTKTFTIVAKAAVTYSEESITGGGANIRTYIGGPVIYMSGDNFKDIYETPTLYGVLYDVEDEYQEAMENYLSNNMEIAYSSTSTLRSLITTTKNIVLLVGGFIGAVFALVGLINFFNLIITNIIARRHEFAIMQGIGMTIRQLRKMIILESLSYVLCSGIVGILASGVMGITAVKTIVENGPSNSMMSFQMTILPAIIMLMLFLALAYIIPVISLHFFNNRSIVERLRAQE